MLFLRARVLLPWRAAIGYDVFREGECSPRDGVYGRVQERLYMRHLVSVNVISFSCHVNALFIYDLSLTFSTRNSKCARVSFVLFYLYLANERAVPDRLVDDSTFDRNPFRPQLGDCIACLTAVVAFCLK